MQHNWIEETLCLPASAIPYALSQRVREAWPEASVLETSDTSFDVDTFASREGLDLVLDPSLPSQEPTFWRPGIAMGLEVGTRSLTWKGDTYQLLRVSWPDGMCSKQRTFFIGPDETRVRALMTRVAETSMRVEHEVFVFAQGRWTRSPALYADIQTASLDDLVLPGTMAQDLVDSCRQFLSSREAYRRYGAPWKRGMLLVGPPGNGKTHFIKALLNTLDLPCFYVRSFDGPRGSTLGHVRRAFDRARRTTPCALVFEDLDSMLSDETRSFFLNELDGFTRNEGILTIATTNHPERLDAAIVHRPSRFDRKVHFDLPGEEERTRYLLSWHRRLPEEAHLSPDVIAAAMPLTVGFSFAYLKEMMLSSLMLWASSDGDGPLGEVVLAQADSLRADLISPPS